MPGVRRFSWRFLLPFAVVLASCGDSVISADGGSSRSEAGASPDRNIASAVACGTYERYLDYEGKSCPMEGERCMVKDNCGDAGVCLCSNGHWGGCSFSECFSLDTGTSSAVDSGPDSGPDGGPDI